MNTASDTFDYRSNAELCERLRVASDQFAEDWKINSLTCYNAFLTGAQIQRDYDLAKSQGEPTP